MKDVSQMSAALPGSNSIAEHPPITAPLLLTGAQRAAARDHRPIYRRLFSKIVYRLFWLLGRFTWFCTLKVEIIRPEAMDRTGPYILASTHLSHLEPFVIGIIYKRQIDWVTRIEFYRTRAWAWLLPRLCCFPVIRQGVPVTTIRTAIRRLEQGRVVGICPEGGVCIGTKSACRGGPIKRGVCLISYRSGAPVVPVVTVGTHTLNHVAPWLPFRRGRLWLAYGSPIVPRQDLPRRDARQVMAEELQRQYTALYEEIRQRYNIDDKWVP